jgi:redox-sensing transcriptional repressor
MPDPERDALPPSSPGRGSPWPAHGTPGNGAVPAGGNGAASDPGPVEPVLVNPGRDEAGLPEPVAGLVEPVLIPPVPPGALTASGRSPRRIPEATVARLPVYLRSLVEVADARTVTISSERLAEMAGVNAAKVRKDLSYLGSYGTRGVGYDVEFLMVQINRVLGLTQDWPVVIVGVGNLGHALANYRGFSARGFRIAALVDADPKRVGEVVADLTVRHMDDLPVIAVEEKIAIGIVATPASSAQEVADLLVAAGITSILNFAPALISVPRDVSLRKVDLSIELQILSFYQQLRVVTPQVAGA